MSGNYRWTLYVNSWQTEKGLDVGFQRVPLLIEIGTTLFKVFSSLIDVSQELLFSFIDMSRIVVSKKDIKKNTYLFTF